MIKIQKRNSSSSLIFYLSPIVAIFLTLFFGSLIFLFLDLSPIESFKIFFIGPISNWYGLSELLVKASPLALIALGLSYCFKNNIYNIGAEGQLTMGALFGGGVGLFFYDSNSIFLLPTMILFGSIGGAFWASIPAILKTKFNTNEILSSLMLTYIALLILDYFVVGPWKDPTGYGLPKSRPFSDAGRLPVLVDGFRAHIGVYFTIIIAGLSYFIFNKTLFGFKLRVTGFSSKASKYAGFKNDNLIIYTFLISGACAGLAGIFEVSGPIGQLYRDISPNYGFTAIIVAFLGRLNPIGIILSSLLIALTYLGAEDAQLFLKIPSAVGFVFQGLVLFFLLGADFLNKYRVLLK